MMQTLLGSQFRRFRPGREQRGVDWLFVVAVLLLVLLGLVMTYSTTFFWGYHDYDDVFYFFSRQLMYAAIGMVSMAVLGRLDYGRYRRWVLAGMGASLIVLMAVLVFGTDSFGARRTFNNGSIQPSEFVKIAVIVYAAAWLDSRREQVQSFFTGLMPFGVIVGVVAGLIYAQPDLSTTAVIVLTASAMFFMAGASLRQIAAVALIGAVAFVVAYHTFAHVNDRIEKFVQNFRAETPRQMEWHAGQSVLTMGAGGFVGTGPGSAEKFDWLPTAHTDSVIAVVGNEFGWLGVMSTLSLFALFAVRGLRIAQRADTHFGAFIAVGVVTWVTAQMLMNLLSSLAMIPFTGVPVPFLSFGGSSLVAGLCACGMLISVSRGSRVLHSTEATMDFVDIVGVGVGTQNRTTTQSGTTRTVRTARAAVRRRNSGTRTAGANRAASTANASANAANSQILGREVRFGTARMRRARPLRWRKHGDGTRISLPPKR
jgi:cell division protein FtsW